MRYYLCIIIGLLNTAIITACDSRPVTTAPSTRQEPVVSVSGMAAIGIIRNGHITAEELSSTGVPLQVIGEAKTDEFGFYSMSLKGYSGGAIRITLSTDSTTQMRCIALNGCGPSTQGQAIPRGAWHAPLGMKMHALLPSAIPGESLNANITPFSHMATERVSALGKWDAETIDFANREVDTLLGLSMLTTPVMDLSNRKAITPGQPMSLIFSSLIAGFANSYTATDDQFFSGVLTVAGNAFRTGTLPLDAPETEVSVASIFSGARRQLEHLQLEDPTGLLQRQAWLSTGKTGLYDPEPQRHEEDRLTRAKRIVSEVRTWGHVISSQLANGQTPFGDKLALSRMVFSHSSDLLTVLNAALIAVADSNYASTDLDTLSLPGTKSAEGFIHVVPGLNQAQVTGVITLTSGAPYEVNLTLQPNPANTQEVEFSVSGSIWNQTAKLDIQSGSVSLAAATSGPSRLHASLKAAMRDTRPSLAGFEGELRFNTNLIEDAKKRRIQTPVSMGLSGHFSNGSSIDFDAAFAVNRRSSDGAVPGWQASLALVAQLDGRPSAYFIASGELDETRVYNADLYIQYGEHRLNINLFDYLLQRSVSIENQDGVSMTLTTPRISGAVTYNGIVYGTIGETSNLPKISFIDSTFETL